MFVDGNIQDYRIEANGKIQTMQKITLKPKERKEFKLIFKPVSGKKGDKVGVIPATIWNPDSLPNEKNPSWGNNQQLSANVPLEIKMKSNGTNQLKATKKHVKVSDIPRKIKHKSVSINADVESIINLATTQNFVPVVDDEGIFIGIIKRSDIINYCYNLIRKSSKIN